MCKPFLAKGFSCACVPPLVSFDLRFFVQPSPVAPTCDKGCKRSDECCCARCGMRVLGTNLIAQKFNFQIEHGDRSMTVAPRFGIELDLEIAVRMIQEPHMLTVRLLIEHHFCQVMSNMDAAYF